MIESQQNETFKKLLSLTTAKGLKAEGLFLLSGEKLVREFLRAPTLEIIHEVSIASMASLTYAKSSIVLSPPLFAHIDVLGTHATMLVLQQPPMPTLSSSDLATYNPQGIELVVPIGDPGNLGALIRSAEAFAVPRILLTKEAAHPFLPKSVKASAGSVMRVPMIHAPTLAEFPDSAIALDTTGTSIHDFTWPQNGLLLVGEEGAGFGTRQFPNRICVPTKGVESLNVVVAASIALSHASTGKV
jgi:TrmH family RNA methyltransferase